MCSCNTAAATDFILILHPIVFREIKYPYLASKLKFKQLAAVFFIPHINYHKIPIYW